MSRTHSSLAKMADSANPMIKILNFILLISLWVSTSQARVSVAFFELRDQAGKLIQLEPGGRFGHVAIEVDGGWLHADIYRGSEWVSSWKKMGWIDTDKNHVVVLSDDGLEDIHFVRIQSLVGLPYDPGFRWDDLSSTYCSKLIAQILDVPPSPMDFSAEYWKDKRDLPVGQPGVSPDGLYRELKRRGFQTYLLKTHLEH
jgi:hypothetical protein